MVISRLKRCRDILQDAPSIMDKLDLIAVYDGIIDEDEEQLLDVINANIFGYQKLLDDILEDNIVTDEEFTEIKSYEKNLKDTILRQAEIDGLTGPENDILNTLFDCLQSLNVLEEL